MFQMGTELQNIRFYEQTLEWAKAVDITDREKVTFLTEHVSAQEEREEITDEQRDYIYQLLIDRANG